MNFEKMASICENLMDDDDSMNMDVLSSKTFRGVGRIRVEMIRFNNGFKPVIRISSEIDPKMSGHVEYSSKIEAIQAYNNMDRLDKVLKYMARYADEPDSMRFAAILQDEGENVKGSLVSASTPGGMISEPSSSSFGSSISSGPSSMPETPPEAGAETPAAGETAGLPETVPGTAGAPGAEAPETPVPNMPPPPPGAPPGV